jgi:teichuronic acid biosynthesis protein TuaE
MKKLIYFLVASVFLGAQILAIDIGIAKISMYRIALPLTIMVMILFVFQNNPQIKLTFYRKAIQYRFVYFFWLVTAVVSIIWAQDAMNWVKGTFFVACGISSILLISTFIQTEKEIKVVFSIVFLMLVMHQLIGFYEIFTNHYMWASLSNNRAAQFSASWSARLPYSIFANINDYSTAIFASIPFACIFFIETKKIWVKVLSVSSVFATLFLLLRTGSRGNQLAVIAFIATLICVKFLNRKVLKYIALFVVISLSICVLIFFFSSSLRFSLYERVQTFINRGGSNFYRINMIINGFIYLMRHLGLGVGAGNVEYWLGNYPIYEVDAPNIHNWFMDILVGYGLITFILYVTMYVYILRQLYVSYKYNRKPFIRTSSLFLFAYVVSFIFSSISSATNIIIEWQWVYWGVLIAYVQFTDNVDQQTEPLNEFRKSSLRTYKGFLLS